MDQEPEEEGEEVSPPAPLYLSTAPLVMVVEARGTPGSELGSSLVAREGCCWAVPWLTAPSPLSGLLLGRRRPTYE